MWIRKPRQSKWELAIIGIEVMWNALIQGWNTVAWKCMEKLAQDTQPWKIEFFSGFMHSHICAHAKHLCEWRTVWRIIEYTTSWMSDGALLPAVRQSLCVCWPVQQMCACCRLASIEANLVEGRRKAVGHPWGLYLQHVHKWILCSDCLTGTAFLRILSSGKYILLCAASCQCHWTSWEVPEGRLAHRHLRRYIPCPQQISYREGSSLWRALCCFCCTSRTQLLHRVQNQGSKRKYSSPWRMSWCRQVRAAWQEGRGGKHAPGQGRQAVHSWHLWRDRGYSRSRGNFWTNPSPSWHRAEEEFLIWRPKW